MFGAEQTMLHSQLVQEYDSDRFGGVHTLGNIKKGTPTNF